VRESIGLLGYGYTARYFAKLLNKARFNVFGTKRNLSIGNQSNNEINLLEFTHKNVLTILEQCSSFLISIAPDPNGIDPFLVEFKKTLLEHSSTIKWIGYLSSTGVYGNHEGKWVDEQSVSNHVNERNSNRLHVEQQWLALFREYNIPVHVFRLASIYGPNRNVIEKILAGKDYSIVKKGQYFSRVHVDDIAALLYQSLQHPTPGEIFNVCDDFPAPSDEVDRYAASILQMGELKLVDYKEAQLSPMARSFYDNNRRVSNQKIKKQLSYQFQYPCYKLGLQNILKQHEDKNNE